MNARLHSILAFAFLVSASAAHPALAEQSSINNTWYIYGSNEPNSADVGVGDAGFIDKFGYCRYVQNNDTEGTLFIPLNTADEWASFRGFNPDGSALDLCCGYQTVSYCGETKTLAAVGIPGNSVQASFGYSATVTYSCSPSGSGAEANGVWQAASVSGDCDPPPPPPPVGSDESGHADCGYNGPAGSPGNDCCGGADSGGDAGGGGGDSGDGGSGGDGGDGALGPVDLALLMLISLPLIGLWRRRRASR